MLIKSKSTGNARVKPEDRVYLEIILFHDDNADIDEVTLSSISTSYRYFSKQNDVQHIINVSSQAQDSHTAESNIKSELIVRKPSGDAIKPEFQYRNLLSTSTLGDLMRKGFIENFDRVLIRIHDPNSEGVSCDSLDENV